MTRVSTRLANLSALSAAVLFGVSVAAVRVTVQEVPPLSLAVLRFGQGGLLLVLALSLWSPKLLRIDRGSLPLLALLGFIFFSAFPWTFNAGLQFTEASRGALMLATMPMWSVWLARTMAGERLTARQLGGVLLTFVGVVMVLAERGVMLGLGSTQLIGDGLLLVTALLGAVYGVLAKQALVRYPALTVTTYAMLLGTAFLLPAALAEGLVPALGRLEGLILALVVFLGVLGGALGFFLWTSALGKLTPTQVAVYVNVNPVVATLLGATLLAESLTVLFGMGFVGVAGGVMLVNWHPPAAAVPASGSVRRPSDEGWLSRDGNLQTPEV